MVTQITKTQFLTYWENGDTYHEINVQVGTEQRIYAKIRTGQTVYCVV